MVAMERRKPKSNQTGASSLSDYVSKFLHSLIRISLGIFLASLYIKIREYNLVGTEQSTERPASTLVIADNMEAGYLDHVVDTLRMFGHKLDFSGSVAVREMKNISKYNLIWTHDYPFTDIKKLKPYQRINHFPGTGFITNKMTLSTTQNIPHMLKAFRLPAERQKFLMEVKREPGKLWIQKSSSHRGISIRRADEVDLELPDTLVQQYMDNPLLIDGKKFDIGIYAALTSVEPLRVYIFDSEALLRFCSNTYIDKSTGKFNASDIDSYVVGDDYTPIWLMPSLLRSYIGANLSMKGTLNAYLKHFGKSGDKIWQSIEDTIRQVYKLKEHHLGRMSRMYQGSGGYNSTTIEGSLNQFFELVRFDFIVDDQLNVYLMEANMSPNLSSRHFPPNRLLYEQVLQSYFSLVGLTQFASENFANLPFRLPDGQVELDSGELKVTNSRHGLDSLISEKDLAVQEGLCASDQCHMSCEDEGCKICYFCLSYDDKLHLKRSIFEHQSKWNFKRLIPSTHDDHLELQLTHPEARTKSIDSNFILTHWYRAKCKDDVRYCSI